MTDATARSGFTGAQMFIAILGAAAAGAAVALLTAPKSGKETRAKIGEALNGGREKARHLPGAVKTAGVAARNAFVDAMREPAEV